MSIKKALITVTIIIFVISLVHTVKITGEDVDNAIDKTIGTLFHYTGIFLDQVEEEVDLKETDEEKKQKEEIRGKGEDLVSGIVKGIRKGAGSVVDDFSD